LLISYTWYSSFFIKRQNQFSETKSQLHLKSSVDFFSIGVLLRIVCVLGITEFAATTLIINRPETATSNGAQKRSLALMGRKMLLS